MSSYDSLLRGTVYSSMESEQASKGLRLDSEDGYREQGDVLISLTPKETDISVISDIVQSLEAAGFTVMLEYPFSMENGTHEPMNKIKMGQGYTDGVQNLVVNGVYIPDIVEAKPLRRVEVVHPDDVVRSNPGDLVYIPFPKGGDEHKRHLYDEATTFLREMGYRVVNTTSDLLSELQ